MQALIELIIGFIAMLAAAVLTQFGVDLDSSQTPQREIHRVSDTCGTEPQRKIITTADRQQGC